MNASAGELTRRVLVVQVGIALAVTALVTLVGPRLLLVPQDVAIAAIRFGLGCTAIVGPIAVLLVRRRLAEHRYALRALALGSSAIEPEDVAHLLRLPGYVATVAITLGLLIPIALVSPLRPAIVDVHAATSFALLVSVLIATAALPLWVLVRDAVSRSVELVHPDVMQALIVQEPKGALFRRVVLRILVAVAMPVGFVAVGAALIAHAHVRRFDAESRERTAEAIAYVLEPAPSVPFTSGRADAMSVARRRGFAARVSDETLSYALERDRDGLTSLTVPFDRGSASIRFAGSEITVLTSGDLLVGLAALALATLFGFAVGRSLASDLVRATERLGNLSTDEVLRGEPRSAPKVRWTVVRHLSSAIDTLTQRFRVFAEAQERAIAAREAAERSRSLLFASVSHDLRSPLNAILGFASLVGNTPLTEGQRESLEVIERRGRELLVLIETILELARVEAGQLELFRTETSVASVVEQAVHKARELTPGHKAFIEAEVEPDLPTIFADNRRLALALAALIGQTVRSRRERSSEFFVQLRVTRTMPGDRIAIDIDFPAGSPSTERIERLLRGEPDPSSHRRYSGLALGLSLSRAVIELHGGKLTVVRAGRTTRLRVEV